jgi:mannose-1-phosphate guanylyltransferase
MVTLVATKGKGSMDLYAQKLAEKLYAPKLYTDIYQKVAEQFNIPVLCPAALKAFWQDWQFIRMLNKLDGIVHLPNQHLGRYGFFLKIPYIITVHDLIRYFDLKGYGIFIHHPNRRDKFYLSLDYRGIKKAARIIAVSQTTKHDLVKHLGIPEERISVVYEGIDHRLFKPTSRRLVDYPYILFVGSEHPRKNFRQLIRAFFKLKTESGFKDLKLVKVGKAGGPEAEFRKQTLHVINELNIPRDVVFVDYVPEEDLPAYYSGAECFILPSLYEGFGLPPLEAMACGCPVIVSDAASLPEVTGDAAIKVKPHDTSRLARAIKMVLMDKQLKRELVSKGLEHAQRFSWEKAARETMEVYESVEDSLSRMHVPARVAEGKDAVIQTTEAVTKAVILVGGEGTRLRPLTYFRPKPMVPVLNHPFLEHTIAYLRKHGIEHIILTLSYLPELIQDYFHDGSKLGIKLSYTLEHSPLGTAGAVKNADRYLDSSFVVLNGDIFTDLDITDMVTYHRYKGAKATIALSRVDNPCAFGVVETDSDGRVRRFVEKPSPDRVTTHWINAGVYILEPEVLRLVPANRHYMFEKGLFPHLLELGEPVYGYPFSGYWLDVGTPDKYRSLNCDLLQLKTVSALLEGLREGEIRCGKDVIIHPSAEIVGPVVIGNGCRIGGEAYIKGPVVMGQNCYLADGTSVEETVLWDTVRVGAGARLRQCVVGSNVRIRENERVINRVVTPDYIKDTEVSDLGKPGISSEVPVGTRSRTGMSRLPPQTEDNDSPSLHGAEH